MRVETTKKIILTKEEQRITSDWYEIFDRDNNLKMDGVWDILTDIHEEDNERAIDYNYYIKIVD